MAKYCSNCGTELKDSDAFCSNCGTSTSSEPKLSKTISTNNIKKTNNQENENKLNKKIILAIITIIVVIGIVVVAGGFLNSETTYDFNDFTLTLPSDYIVESSNPMSARIYDANNVHIATVESSGILINGNKEVAIGGHKGYINENVGAFYFEEGGHKFLIKDGQGGTGSYDDIEIVAKGFKAKGTDSSNQNSVNNAQVNTNSKSWKLVDTYSGSGTGIETYDLPEGKIKVKISAFPIKNYATNSLSASSSTGDSVSVEWGSKSAVETKSDSMTFDSTGGDMLSINYYETVNWEVKIYQYS